MEMVIPEHVVRGTRGGPRIQEQGASSSVALEPPDEIPDPTATWPGSCERLFIGRP